MCETPRVLPKRTSERMFADQGNTRARNARAPCRAGCSRPTPYRTRAAEEDAQALVCGSGQHAFLQRARAVPRWL